MTRRIDTLREHAPAILPSLLKCDFGDLVAELKRLEAAELHVLHLDVMDGHFVPNLTYGMPIVEGLRKHTDLVLDVHLMISDPLQYAKEFVKAGADSLTFHVEAVNDPVDVLKQIRDLGVGAGLALNPGTPIESVIPHLDLCDLVLVMSVDAGFGGQAFNPVALQKLQQLRELRPELLLQVDGGINAETIRDCHEAGADLFVVGSAIFGADDYASAVGDLLERVQHSGSH